MTTHLNTKSFTNTPQRCISAKEKVEQPKNLVSVEDELKENEATVECNRPFGMAPVRDGGSGPAELNRASLERGWKLTNEQAQMQSEGKYPLDLYGTNQDNLYHGQGSWTMQGSKTREPECLMLGHETYLCASTLNVTQEMINIRGGLMLPMEKRIHEIKEEAVLRDGDTPFVPLSAIERKCWETVAMHNLMGVAPRRSGRTLRQRQHDDMAVGMKQFGWRHDGGGRVAAVRQCNSYATARSNRTRRYYFRKPAAAARPRRGGSTTTRQGDLDAADRDGAGPGQGWSTTAAQLYDCCMTMGQQACGATTTAQPSARAAARWRGQHSGAPMARILNREGGVAMTMQVEQLLCSGAITARYQRCVCGGRAIAVQGHEAHARGGRIKVYSSKASVGDLVKARLGKPNYRQQQAQEDNMGFYREEKMKMDGDLKVVRTDSESQQQGYATKEELQRQSARGARVRARGARVRMEARGARVRLRGALVRVDARGAQVRMEELLVAIADVPAPQPSEVGEKLEKNEGVPTRDKVKGKGHEGMELKLKIEDAPSDKEDGGPPALIAAEGGSNNETCGQVLRLGESMTNWLWRTGLEELALRRDKEIMVQNGVADVWRVAIPKEMADIRMKASKVEDEWLPRQSPSHWWWNNQLKASAPRAEGLGQESYQRHLDVEVFIITYDRIISNYSDRVWIFAREEHDRAKVEVAHAKYDQALMDHDVGKGKENQGEEDHGVQFKPRLGAKTTLKVFLDKYPKEPDWVARPEGDYDGDGKDANGLAGLPIPEGCLRVNPVRVANGQSGPGWESESSPGPAV